MAAGSPNLTLHRSQFGLRLYSHSIPQVWAGFRNSKAYCRNQIQRKCHVNIKKGRGILNSRVSEKLVYGTTFDNDLCGLCQHRCYG